jgi:hypothetical protein
MVVVTRVEPVVIEYERDRPPPALGCSVSGDPYVSAGEVFVVLAHEAGAWPRGGFLALAIAESRPEALYVAECDPGPGEAAGPLVEAVVRLAGERAVAGRFPDAAPLAEALGRAGFEDLGYAGTEQGVPRHFWRLTRG